MSRNRLYLVLFLALLLGYVYILISYLDLIHNQHTLCMFKNVTGIACPSCGSTRSVLLIANGDIKSALLINPLGFLISIIMIAMPLWLLHDIIYKKASLYSSYKKAETFIRIKWVAIPLVVLVLANWGWNIYKEL
ncbi:DUF2752 domain-containing protein [Flavobacterium sp. Sd200]|uniref:DUF2752 domain-containing protein n=1 Tax=Flavobacterium sp. Sd200 TaxID=2692211 RepID=UPI001367FDEF|nr:DUF2752 domain-containing protein [Flavobacterium sp. Sd200]MXN92448.1 DUF2752 domain-containing protein [Flavobacterium sp. Sd200]